jgi:hypothetical protein
MTASVVAPERNFSIKSLFIAGSLVAGLLNMVGALPKSD